MHITNIDPPFFKNNTFFLICIILFFLDSKETNETEKDVTEEVNTDVIEPVVSLQILLL